MVKRSPPLVAVVGGGGFIGRYVVEFLARAGARVRVAQRYPKRAYFVQPLGSVGQIDFAACDVTRRETLERPLAGADAVVNLVAVMGRGMEAVNVEGAGNVAAEAAKAGAGALVHVSAIGADPDGESDYARTKGEAERRVRKAFPSATIIRPSLVFGPEDQLTNRFAGMMAAMRAYPVLAPRTRFQPVYVRDLGQAIAAAALDPDTHGGKVYEIGGPQVMTMHELSGAIRDAAGASSELVDLPDVFGSLISKLGFLPGAPITADQWKMLKRDNVASPTAPGLAAFGIEPTPLAAVAPDWLGRFRKGGRFAKPVAA